MAKRSHRAGRAPTSSVSSAPYAEWLYSAERTANNVTVVEQENTGYSVNGGFAEYAIADPNYVGHLPANVSEALLRVKGMKRDEAKAMAMRHDAPASIQ
mgnify:CR=1 FL=1